MVESKIYIGLMQWSQQAQALQAQAKAMDGKIAEAQGAADLLQEELDWKKYYQYADLTSAEDFGEKSQYKSTANGKKRSTQKRMPYRVLLTCWRRIRSNL